MTLQDPPFKNCKTEDQHTKTEEEIQINANFLIKYNQLKAEIATSNYEMGRKSVKLTLISWRFTIPFNLCYVDIINSGLTNVYIKISSDNLTKSLMIHEMCGCLCILHRGNKHHLCVRDLSTTSSSHPPEGEETRITVY